MPDYLTPPTESPNSFRFVMRGGELIIRREFQAFGTRAQVFQRLGKNVVLPAMGDALPTDAPLDPAQGGDGPFVNQLDGLGVDGKDLLSREWRQRLRVGDIQIEGNVNERTTHKVIVDYRTSAVANPFAPVVQIRVGSETLLLKWDWNGNPIAPGFEGGIPVEVPIVYLTYTIPMRRFHLLFDEIADQIGKTNSEHWTVLDPTAPTPRSDNKHQWVFMGADAVKGGEQNWKPTFRFVWYPPIAIQNFFVRQDAQGPITEQVIPIERGRYFYRFVENADGTINQNPGGDINNPDPDHGLQRTQVRESFDFNTFFTREGIDPKGEG